MGLKLGFEESRELNIFSVELTRVLRRVKKYIFHYCVVYDVKKKGLHRFVFNSPSRWFIALEDSSKDIPSAISLTLSSSYQQKS